MCFVGRTKVEPAIPEGDSEQESMLEGHAWYFARIPDSAFCQGRLHVCTQFEVHAVTQVQHRKREYIFALVKGLLVVMHLVTRPLLLKNFNVPTVCEKHIVEHESSVRDRLRWEWK